MYLSQATALVLIVRGRGDAYQIIEAIQNVVDLLAVGQADVRFAHQTPHLLTDVILVNLSMDGRTNG